MFDDEVVKEKPKKKTTEKKDPPKVGRFFTQYGRMPVSYVYGSEFPTCWLHHKQKQVF